MNRLTPTLKGVVLGVVALLVVWLTGYSLIRAGSVIPNGDVMASVSNGLVDEFTPTGTLVQTLNTGHSGVFTTGSVFDSSGNFYVTDFNGNAVTEFDPTGVLIGDVGAGAPFNDDESILFDSSGNAYVGNAGSNQLIKFPPGFGSNSTFALTTEFRGTDWNDLAADQCTDYYTSESVDVLRFNVCTSTQLSNFNVASLPGPTAYALRILPIAVGSLPVGSVLVADTTEVAVLDNTGTKVRDDTAVGGGGGVFSLNLDPDGKTYWTGDFNTAEVFRVDIATGSIITSWNTGTGAGTLFGISVKGQITAAVPTPTPTNKCPLTQGFWKNHPSAWKLTTLLLGTTNYTAAQALTILQTPPKGDASLILADQLIAALLNIANGSNPAPVSSTISDADSLLGAGPIPEHIAPSSAVGQKMVNDASILDSYNNDQLTPNCTQ